MLRRPLRIVLVTLGLAAPACGARTGLLFDGVLGEGLASDLDASAAGDADADAADRRADADEVRPIVTPQAFVCPSRPLDVCGDNAYQPGAPWPSYQRCSPHTGQSDAVGPANPVLLWGKPTSPALLGPPAIAADGTIYVAGGGGLTATNADGSLRWSAQPSDLNAGFSNAAIAPDGTIYVALDRLYAFNPNGGLKWDSYLLGNGGVSPFGTLAAPGSSVVLGPCGTLFIGSPSGLHIMDFLGQTIWDVGGAGLTPAVAADGSAYYATADGRLFAINSDGTTRWIFSLNGGDAGRRRWTQAAPILGPDGTLYVAESTGFDAIRKDGTELWSVPWNTDAGPSPLGGAALGADGTIYVVFPDLTLRALTPRGTLKWIASISVYGSSPILDARGTIYELGSDGVYAIAPEGQIAWAITLPGVTSENGTLAMGADGTLYASTQGLYAIGNAP